MILNAEHSRLLRVDYLRLVPSRNICQCREQAVQVLLWCHQYEIVGVELVPQVLVGTAQTDLPHDILHVDVEEWLKLIGDP